MPELKPRECRLGDPEAESIISTNLRIMDMLVHRIQGQCTNCRWPISVAREENFSVMGLGPVCATCHGMYTAVNFNGFLKDPNYFRNLHELWKRDLEKFKKNRGKMGLDD